VDKIFDEVNGILANRFDNMSKAGSVVNAFHLLQKPPLQQRLCGREILEQVDPSVPPRQRSPGLKHPSPWQLP
jgi:hypothetical protein